MNDLSLEHGGIFDILRPRTRRPDGTYDPAETVANFTPWDAPHAEHDRGIDVDISFIVLINGAEQTLIKKSAEWQVLDDIIFQAVQATGGEYSSDYPAHWHVRFRW